MNQNNNARNNGSGQGPAIRDEPGNTNGQLRNGQFRNGNGSGNGSGNRSGTGNNDRYGQYNNSGNGPGRPWQETGARRRDGGDNHYRPENDMAGERDRPMGATAQIIDVEEEFYPEQNSMYNEERLRRERLGSKRLRSGSGEEDPDSRRPRQ